MKKLIFLLLSSFFVPVLFAADNKTELRLQQIEESVSAIKLQQHSYDGEQKLLQEKTKAIWDMIDVSNGSIANEIAASERLMGIMALVIALAAIFVGLYVTILHNRILKMSDTVKSISKDVEKKEIEVNELVDDINEHFDSLYTRIRRADTKEYVKRLERVPLDIVNLGEILLARELEQEDFEVLKRAYKNLIKSGKESEHPGLMRPSYGESYRLQFFQHFAGKSISDDFLRGQVLDDLNRIVKCCFDNDIKKSLSDLAPELRKRTVPFDRLVVLKKIIAALDQSEFKGNADVYDIIENGIADPELWAMANTPDAPKQD